MEEYRRSHFEGNKTKGTPVLDAKGDNFQRFNTES